MGVKLQGQVLVCDVDGCSNELVVTPRAIRDNPDWTIVRGSIRCPDHLEPSPWAS